MAGQIFRIKRPYARGVVLSEMLVYGASEATLMSWTQPTVRTRCPKCGLTVTVDFSPPGIFTKCPQCGGKMRKPEVPLSAKVAMLPAGVMGVAIGFGLLVFVGLAMGAIPVILGFIGGNLLKLLRYLDGG